jgi:hypothetical protein
MATGDLFDLYFTYVKETEPPIIFHRWSLIASIGAWLGRSCWLPFGASRIFPNQYIMLIGNPGSRKSSAIKGAKRVLSAAGYNTFAAEKTTKEKFLLDLQGEGNGHSSETITNLFGDSHGGQAPREVFIPADEFNEFVGSGNLEFLSMLGALWDYDDPENPYKSRTKNSKSIEIFQPTISILGGNTYAGFAEAFPLAVLGQGFMSRLVLIHSEPSGRKITIPPIPNATLLGDIVHELGNIRSSSYGELTLSKQALSALDAIYRTWEELDDQRFKHYSTRRFTHLLKLCIIVMAVAKRREILVEDVLLANTILSFAEQSMPKAMGELGKKKSSDTSSLIMNILYEARAPVLPMELWEHVEKDLEHMSDLTRLLMNLQAANKIQGVKTGTKGLTGWLPKMKQVNNKQMYVDYNLLKGREISS